MKTDLFDFDLPADRIALRPVTPRDAARLLVVRPGEANEFDDRTIADLPDLLHAGDALVVNDSKVIAARLKGRRIGRGTTEPEIEATLHRRIDGSHWRAFILGAKKVQVGDTLRFGDEGKVCFLNELDAQVSQKHEGGEVTLSFSFHGPVLDQAIAERGDMPLPPYIASRRAPDEQDRTDYQTLFAQSRGLGCGADRRTAFYRKPVAAPRRSRHRPAQSHSACRRRHLPAGEIRRYRRPRDACRIRHRVVRGGGCAQRRAGQRRADRGGRLDRAAAAGKSAAGDDGKLKAFSGETAIFITPGYRFKAVDLMLTNFHLPRSTLFMLVAAFSGLDTMKRAYAHAVRSGYRFYSYGDACLLYPQA